MVDDIGNDFIYIPNKIPFNDKKREMESSKVTPKRVSKLFHLDQVDQKDPVIIKDQKKQEQHQRPYEKAKDHFGELSKAVERAHKILEELQSPYRFCIYKKEDEIFIDIVILDENGDAKLLKQENITYEKFYTLLKRIERGEGFMLDENY